MTGYYGEVMKVIEDSVESVMSGEALVTKIMFPELNFICYYKDGSAKNGCTVIAIKYDFTNRNWYFRSCKDNFERTHAYNGTYRAWEENYENDRQIEIKEI